jgi:DNA-binding PadR family transcriptional regulator
MALRHALLAALTDGPASGYELTKWFDAGVANFWHATKAQLYAELTKLEADGLVAGTEVVQHDRPNKRVMTVTDAGLAELDAFVAGPSKATAIKSDLLVKVRALDVVDPEPLRAELHAARAETLAKLAAFEAVHARMRKGRTHAEHLATARRVGPYLTLRMGITREREQLAWIDEVLEALDVRASRTSNPRTPTPL